MKRGTLRPTIHYKSSVPGLPERVGTLYLTQEIQSRYLPNIYHRGPYDDTILFINQ